MNLSDRFTQSVARGDPLMLVRTDEWEDAELTISEVCKEKEWAMVVWDCRTGMQSAVIKTEQPKAAAPPPGMPANLQAVPAGPKKMPAHESLVTAIDTIGAYHNQDDEDGQHVQVVLVARNLHLLWQKSEPDGARNVIQTIQNIVKPFKSGAKMVVGLASPGEMPPAEVLPAFDIVDHPPPRQPEFVPVFGGVDAPEQINVKLSDEEIESVAEASCGLTRLQAERAYATAYVRLTHMAQSDVKKLDLGRFFCEVVEEEKNAILNADGMLRRWNGPETFDSIGGNEAVKEYLKKVMDPKARRRKSKRNCCLLIGPPGTGKTLLAKALGRYTGRKTYGANLSANKSKWVGESEANTRRMFGRASAMSNIVLYFDEINEQVASGESDGHSVDTAMRQNLMEWLDNHWLTDDVFAVMTANDISSMHMALTRPGRVDAIFYVGLPGKEQKQAIWKICIKKYQLEEWQYEELPADFGWAGVEIDACCATADNFGCTVQEAALYVIPSSVRVKEQIEKLKEWAHERCLDAETGKLFRKDKAIDPAATGALSVDGHPIRRKVMGDPIKKKP